MIIGCGVRKFKKQRPLNRQTGARSLFCKRVQIRHQPIALFDKTSADSLRLSAANLGSAQRETAQPQILQHRRCQAKMIPRAAVVARPGCSIPLAAGVGSASEDEWTPLWT